MGPNDLVHVSRTLWLVEAIPTAGVLWQTLVARPWIKRARDHAAASRALDSARVAGLAGITLTGAAFLAHVARLGDPTDVGALIDPVIAAAPVGLIDTSLVLALDRLSATFGAVACLVGLAAAFQLALRPPAERGWAAWAWLEFALASTLVTFLADGVWTLATGWAMAIVAGAWILASDDARASVAMGGRGALALGALMVGGAVVFSGLGPDSKIRFEAVHGRGSEILDESEPLPPFGTLTMTSPPGAQVLAEEPSSPSWRVPFVRASLPAGSHVIHVRGAPGTEDSAVAVFVAPGDDVTLVRTGPTLSFHAMASELGLGERTDDAGSPGAPEALGTMLAWIFAASLMCGFPSAARSPAPLAAFASSLVGATLGPYFLARVSFLWQFAPGSGLLVAGVGIAALVIVVLRAYRRPSNSLIPTLSSGTPPALALLALGTLPHPIAMMAVPVIGLAGSALAFSIPRSTWRGAPLSRAEEWPFVDASEHFGRFCARIDRWVIGAWVAAAAAIARGLAWTLAAGEEAVSHRIGDGAASSAVRRARDVEAVVGAPLGSVVWGVLGLFAAFVLAHAIWFGS